jgi:hypothetical protein
MRGKKILFLFLALLLPVCIFIFLKLFGKNQFDVPLLFHTRDAEFPTSCGIAYTAPYTIPDSVLNMLRREGETPVYVLNFFSDSSVLARVVTEIGEEEVTIIQARDLPVDSSKFQFLKNCILLAKDPANIILIDDEKRIRGFYEASDRDEIDRLLVELNIILKRY